jgi:hypothetical protein
MGRGYVSTLATAEGTGNALSSFTTSASLLSGSAAQALCTIPPDNWAIGKALRITAVVAIGNVVTAAPTFTFNVLFGATTVFNTGALQMSTTAHTALPVWIDILLTCRAVGASANLMGQAIVTGRPLVKASGADVTTVGDPTILGPATTPAVGSNFNSNASQQVDFQVACSASSASNTAQLYEYILQDLCTIAT